MVIHLIASPRNVSTALMYSVGQHSAIHPVDEPFYAAYLTRSGTDHPDRALILQSQPVDRQEVFAQIEDLESRHGVVFLKNMAHHIVENDLSLMEGWKHCFLIRHPKLHIYSFAKVITHPSLEALGTTTQRKWYDILTSGDQQPHLIDANHLLKNPEAELRRFCGKMEINFQPGMLSWPAGPKSFDGCWAPHWYQNTWKSTRFGSPRDPETVELPDHLMSLYDACMVDYQYLYNHI